MPVQNIDEKVQRGSISTVFVLHNDAIFMKKYETIVWKSAFQNNDM